MEYKSTYLTIESTCVLQKKKLNQLCIILFQILYEIHFFHMRFFHLRLSYLRCVKHKSGYISKLEIEF